MNQFKLMHFFWFFVLYPNLPALKEENSIQHLSSGLWLTDAALISRVRCIRAWLDPKVCASSSFAGLGLSALWCLNVVSDISTHQCPTPPSLSLSFQYSPNMTMSVWFYFFLFLYFCLFYPLLFLYPCTWYFFLFYFFFFNSIPTSPRIGPPPLLTHTHTHTPTPPPPPFHIGSSFPPPPPLSPRDLYGHADLWDSPWACWDSN